VTDTDRHTHGHRMTAKAALHASIARQQLGKTSLLYSVRRMTAVTASYVPHTLIRKAILVVVLFSVRFTDISGDDGTDWHKILHDRTFWSWTDLLPLKSEILGLSFGQQRRHPVEMKLMNTLNYMQSSIYP